MSFIVSGPATPVVCSVLSILGRTVTNPSPGVAVVAAEEGSVQIPVSFGGTILISGPIGSPFAASRVMWGRGGAQNQTNGPMISLGGAYPNPLITDLTLPAAYVYFQTGVVTLKGDGACQVDFTGV